MHRRGVQYTAQCPQGTSRDSSARVGRTHTDHAWCPPWLGSQPRQDKSRRRRETAPFRLSRCAVHVCRCCACGDQAGFLSLPAHARTVTPQALLASGPGRVLSLDLACSVVVASSFLCPQDPPALQGPESRGGLPLRPCHPPLAFPASVFFPWLLWRIITRTVPWGPPSFLVTMGMGCQHRNAGGRIRLIATCCHP